MVGCETAGDTQSSKVEGNSTKTKGFNAQWESLLNRREATLRSSPVESTRKGDPL